MLEDEIKIQAQNLIDQAIEENKIKEEKINSSNTSGNLSKNGTNEDFNKDDDLNKLLKKNTVINKRRKSIDLHSSSSDSNSQESSPIGSSDDEQNNENNNEIKINKNNNEIKINKNNNDNNNDKDIRRNSIISTDLENLMLSKDLNIKACTLISCAFCITTTALSIITSLILQRLLTFDYGQNYDNQKGGKKEAIEKITMNHTMIHILLAILCFFNSGILIMISLNNDHMLTKLIYTDLKWYFVLTQLAFGSLFLITLLWETDLWTINVCLSISMLTILILAFYFTEIKQKKNMSKGTLVFIYIYISVLFSFISYVTLYNLSCILMENMEVQEEDVQKISYRLIKVAINAGQTILSFVLLTYYKDIFFAYTSAYIECAVFIKKDINFEGENIALLVMALSIVLGIILTLCKYGKKAFGYVEISENFN